VFLARIFIYLFPPQFIEAHEIFHHDGEQQLVFEPDGSAPFVFPPEADLEDEGCGEVHLEREEQRE